MHCYCKSAHSVIPRVGDENTLLMETDWEIKLKDVNIIDHCEQSPVLSGPFVYFLEKKGDDDDDDDDRW